MLVITYHKKQQKTPDHRAVSQNILRQYQLQLFEARLSTTGRRRTLRAVLWMILTHAAIITQSELLEKRSTKLTHRFLNISSEHTSVYM